MNRILNAVFFILWTIFAAIDAHNKATAWVIFDCTFMLINAYRVFAPKSEGK